MNRAPFSPVSNLGQQELVLSSNLPPLKRVVMAALAAFADDVMLPGDLAPSISANPAPIDIHVDVHVSVSIDVNSHIGCRDSLSQSRRRGDGGQERNSDLQRPIGFAGRSKGIGEIGGRSIIFSTQISWMLNLESV